MLTEYSFVFWFWMRGSHPIVSNGMGFLLELSYIYIVVWILLSIYESFIFIILLHKKKCFYIYSVRNFKVKKIGEGTYGEVFMLSKGKTSSVLKVIAISEDPNIKNLQGISSVYSEVTISK